MTTESCSLAENAAGSPATSNSTATETIESIAATTEREETTAADDTTATGCPKCGSTEPWGLASWCPNCGYYPAFGTCVDTGPRQEEPAEAVDFIKLVPQWLWILAAGLVGIFALSLAARLSLPPQGRMRWLCSLLQIMAGLSAAVVGQITAFLASVPESEKSSPFDIFMKPIEVWQPTFRKLPEHAWRVWCAGWGVWGVFCAVVLVGGIRYSSIFDDWGFEKRAQANLVQSIVQQAREDAEEGAKSLGDAVNDFAGEAANVDDEEKKKEELDKLPHSDCLIIGYVADPNDGFSSILIASVVGNNLRYVGSVPAADIPAEGRTELFKKMQALENSKPFVKTNVSATWLKPVLMCRVAYKDMTRSKQFKEPRFREMLADVKSK